GGIMAKNAAWRMSVDDWKLNISNWIARHKPKDILNTDIFFDAVYVHGDKSLSDQLMDHAFLVGGQSREFLQLMSMNAVDIKIPLGFLGRFQLRDGRMDLKKGGILPIFSAARVVAIQYGIRALSTPARLAAARNLDNINTSSIDLLIEAHRIILGAILKQQLADIQAGIPPSNLVDPKSLSKTDQDQLKWALRQVNAVSGLLGDPILMH
ncbi:MAG: DUF294 nucleotidyltransferase-like domain-containing protein, partial [Fimbriimonadaceae bacterium]|nr:DUF294 nucleotidyltransferase-like domain-containing protein [Alphaproteobacteria bacterium]